MQIVSFLTLRGWYCPHFTTECIEADRLSWELSQARTAGRWCSCGLNLVHSSNPYTSSADLAFKWLLKADNKTICNFYVWTFMRIDSGMFVTALLSYNSHIIYSINLKRTFQWFLVYLQSCETITTINFRTFSSPRKILHTLEQLLPNHLHLPQP